MLLLFRGSFAPAFSCNISYFLESICYYNSWKLYNVYLMYWYAWNLRKYNQTTVVNIVVKIVIMYMIVKTIIQIVVIVTMVAL